MPRYAKPIMREGEGCKYCGTGTMVRKSGRFGDFLGCNNYPRCTNIARLAPNINSADYQTQEWLLKNGKHIDPAI